MSADSSDDEDLGAFAFLSKAIVVEERAPEIKEQDTLPDVTFLRYPDAVDRLFMCRNVDALLDLAAKAQPQTLVETSQTAQRDGSDQKQISPAAKSEGDADADADAAETEIARRALDILQGKYHAALLSAPPCLSVAAVLGLCASGDCIVSRVREIVNSYISEGDGGESPTADGNSFRASQNRLQTCLLLAAAWLELYCQENYTGPELESADVHALYGFGDGKRRESSKLGGREGTVGLGGCISNLTDAQELTLAAINRQSIQHLEVDGIYPFSMCRIPHALVIARAILFPLADPSRAPWKAGIKLDAEGRILKVQLGGASEESVGRIAGRKASSSADALHARTLHACAHSKAAAWLGARACVVHARTLQNLSADVVPTLWRECQDAFQTSRDRYGVRENTDISAVQGQGSSATASASGESGSEPPRFQREVATQLWLETGLSFHHFDCGDKGKSAFKNAKSSAALQTILTGALGKRTKHQKKDYAQMVLLARSSLLASDGATDTETSSAAAAAAGVALLVDPNAGKIVPDASNIIRGGGMGGLDLEDVEESGMARNGLGANGLEVRRVGDGTSPDSDALATAVEVGSGSGSGGWENSKYEVGRRLVSEGSNGQEVAVREVFLDDCDGGASENILLEGGPQITDDAVQVLIDAPLHVIDQAVILALCLDVSNSNADEWLTREERFPYLHKVLQCAQSWMIHSTALLERSWLEFEKGRTADRAMLQMQALLDQHTTKLTVFQSTFDSVTKDSAPAQERLAFLHCIVYPSQYELKRNLAQKYMQSQVIASALGYFRELEMWDEVVACYQLMDKPHRAELVVRERLLINRTPYMVCSLADLTSSEALYEEAWLLSKCRFARAKRTLGKLCFDRGDYAACVEHLSAALAISPMVATSWYLKGIAAMRLQQWDDALVAFSRCVQQDTELGEAWANSGSIYMQRQEYAKAHAAFEEAYKLKRDSWRIVENLVSVCLMLNKFQDCVMYMNICLDMRHKSERPVLKQELRRLCFMTAAVNRKSVRVARDAQRQARKLERESAALPAPSEEGEGGEGGAGVASNAQTTQAQHFQVDMKSLLEEDDDDYIFVCDDDMDRTCVVVEKLLRRITSTVNSDAEVWDVFADFEISLGRLSIVLECRVRQFRALLNVSNWEKDDDKVAVLVRSAKSLTAVHLTKVATYTDLYACQSMLNTAVKRMEELHRESGLYREMLASIAHIAKAYAEFSRSN